MDSRTYFAKTGDPPKETPAMIMLALNKNAEAVATIKDDLEKMMLKQENITNETDSFIHITIDDKEFNIAIDEEWRERPIRFRPRLFYRLWVEDVLLALILICLRNEARAKIREEKWLQFEAFCQATATSVLKQDEKEIIGRYIMGKRSKEPVVSMDVAAATVWFKNGNSSTLKGLKKELVLATPGMDRELLATLGLSP